MKKQAKHIRYLRLFTEFICNHVFILVLFVVLFLVLNLITPLSELIGNVTRYLASLLGNVEPTNKGYLKYIATAVISAFLSAIVKKLIDIAGNSLKAGKKTGANKRRLFYRFWNRFYRKHSSLNYISLLFINVFLQGKPLDYYGQQNYITKLSELVKSNAPQKNITWLSGDAYSGKTTVIFRFLERLAEENNREIYEKFEKNIYYFDLSSHSLDITKIYDEIYNGYYSDSLLILDNVHKLDSENLCYLITTMETNHSNIQHLICLSRHLDSFCYSREIQLRLQHLIAQHAVHIEIGRNSAAPMPYTGTAIEQIQLATKQQESDFTTFCLKTVGEAVYSSEILSIQCYNLFCASQSVRKKAFVLNVFEALNNPNGKTDRALMHVLSFIVHATLFSGGFDDRWFAEYTKQVLNARQRLRAKRYFRELQRTCFISLLQSSYMSQYVFHEKLARHYFEKITCLDSYQRINTGVLLYLVYKNRKSNKHATAWKYGLIAQPAALQNTQLFDKSLHTANFQTLMEDLQYICDVKGLKEEQFCREYGILHDRLGNLHKAIAAFEKSPGFNPVLYINKIQVDHAKFTEEAMQTILQSPDMYCKMAALYWKGHIKIHDGVFDFDAFVNMSVGMEKHKEAILQEHVYDGIHLIRRWYFDCFRCYYLSGRLDPEKLRTIIENSAIDEIKRLAEFDAYDNKFRSAFYLHYDLLFLSGIWGKVTDIELSKCSDIMKLPQVAEAIKQARETGDNITELLVEQATYYYELSRISMKNIMDKSYRYSDLRIWELRLARQVVKLDDILRNEKDLLAYIEHSQEIKIDEYVAYGYTYLLKTYLVGLYSYATEYDDNGKETKNLYITDKKIQNCFAEIEKYHRQYRNGRGNRYCALRLKLYRILYSTMVNTLEIEPAQALKELAADAEKAGYLREHKLITYILAGNLNAPTIIKVFKFYPLVLQ